MKIRNDKDKFSLIVVWRDAIFDNPDRAAVEAEYGRSMVACAGGSIDTLKEVVDAARQDVNMLGPKYHSYLRMDAVARVNACKGYGMSREEVNTAKLGLMFNLENGK